MRVVFWLACLLVLAGCGLIPSIGTGEGESADGGGAGAVGTTSATGADASVKGIDCITEQQTGATLCTGLSTCPGLFVDHDVFPTCGFRPAGGVIDIECACQGFLCPLGVAATCEQAQKLLASQTESGVCLQLSEDRCTKGAAATPTGNPNCDKACASECGNVPGCLKLCGC